MAPKDSEERMAMRQMGVREVRTPECSVATTAVQRRVHQRGGERVTKGEGVTKSAESVAECSERATQKRRQVRSGVTKSVGDAL